MLAAGRRGDLVAMSTGSAAAVHLMEHGLERHVRPRAIVAPMPHCSSMSMMCEERYAATEDLLKLSGRLRLIIAQVDNDANDVSAKKQDSAAALSDEEEEEVDELVYGEDLRLSENSDDDAE